MEQFDKSSAQNVAKVGYLVGGAVGFGFGIGSILILSAILMVRASVRCLDDVGHSNAIGQWWGAELYLTQRIGLSNLYATFEAVLIAGQSFHPYLSSFVLRSPNIALAASRLFTFVPDLARMVQGFRAICQWEDRQPEIASLDLAKAPVLDKVQGTITFDSCSLQYASRPKPAIDNLNLVIPAGQSVAFCGWFISKIVI
jgi:ABC-type multidrug transport system fused ATPase/permease subunit